MLEKMARVRVLCARESVPKAIDALYEFGAIQIMRSRQGEPDVPLSSFEEISKALIGLRAAEKALSIMEPDDFYELEPVDRLLSEYSKLSEELSRAYASQKRVAELRAEREALLRKLLDLEPFLGIKIKPILFSSSSSASLLYFAPKLASAQELAREARKLGCDAEAIESQGKQYCLVAVDLRKASDVERELSRLGSRLPLPQVKSASFTQEAEAVRHELAQLAKAEVQAQESVTGFVLRNGKRLSVLRAQLEEHAKKAELPNKFAHGTFIEVIEGWVPKKMTGTLEEKLTLATASKVVVEFPATSDEPPALLSNPPVVRRFEFLVRFFSLPRSDEIDPTLIIGITFPLFFGMILGDIGYGLLTIAIALLMRFKSSNELMRDLGGMMALSGFSTFIFGIVFGEFFGGEKMLGIHLTPFIHRGGHGLDLLIGVVLLVGLIHQALGFLLGAYIAYSHKNYKHANAKLSWIALEFSLAAFAGSLVAPSIFPPAYGMLYAGLILVSMVALYVFEGAYALIEVPGLIANVFSYLRIMALGLSGVILAQMINQLPVDQSVSALSASVSGGFDALAFASALASLLLFGIILVVGHVGALLLGIFESGVQALRLHYVEFFSKFYRGGGTPFSPLRKSR